MGMCVTVLAPLWPFITQDTWPQLFEIGYHHIPMRDWPEWLARGQTIGWDHSWFNGHPTYQFYFPGPALGWMILDVILPSHTAYILLTLLPIPMLVVAVWWLARTWGISSPSALLLAASALLAWGMADSLGWHTGSVAVMYGMFSHGWSVALGVFYLAVVNRLQTVGTPRWWVAAVCCLAAAFISHPLPAVVAGLAGLTIVHRKNFRSLIAVTVAAAGLTAWWWIPAVGQAAMSSSMNSPALTLSWKSSPVIDWKSALFLPSALWGGWRLYLKASYFRWLVPALFAAVAPALQALLFSQDAWWSGGRLLSFWHLAIATLGIWAILDWALQLLRGRVATVAVVVLCCITTFLYLHALEARPSMRHDYDSFVSIKQHDKEAVDNNRALPDCESVVSMIPKTPPATVFIDSGGWWMPNADCQLWVLYGLNIEPWAHHRNTFGVLLESSPTRLFADGVTLAGMMTLGVDYYLTPDPPPEGSWVERLPDPGGGVALLRIGPPPEQWPSEWQTGLSAGEWLEGSLERFEQWNDPSDIVIPVRGAPPSGATRNPPLRVVRPDWSDDRHITFHAPHRRVLLCAGFIPSELEPHDPWGRTVAGRTEPNRGLCFTRRKSNVTVRP